MGTVVIFKWSVGHFPCRTTCKKKSGNLAHMHFFIIKNENANQLLCNISYFSDRFGRKKYLGKYHEKDTLLTNHFCDENGLVKTQGELLSFYCTEITSGKVHINYFSMEETIA